MATKIYTMYGEKNNADMFLEVNRVCDTLISSTNYSVYPDGQVITTEDWLMNSIKCGLNRVGGVDELLVSLGWSIGDDTDNDYFNSIVKVASESDLTVDEVERDLIEDVKSLHDWDLDDLAAWAGFDIYESYPTAIYIIE